MKECCVFKKVFIRCSIVFILSLILIYTGRFIYFYKLENGKSEEGNVNNYFSDKLQKTINVSDATGGLYIVEDEYVYKYNAKDNYLWYSGQLWQILKINEDSTIDIVMKDSLSILNAKFLETNYIDDYLKDFYNNLDQEFLVELEYCSDSYDTIDDIKCENKTKSNIALLDIYTYDNAGGNSSFLNNKTSFYLINTNTDKNNWYVNTTGAIGISDDIKSFGIRPVLRLKNEINLVSGDGSLDNPYIIKNKDSINIGEYVKFSDALWRITSLDNGITISSVNCIKNGVNCLLSSFGNTNVYEESSIYDYLNTTYYNSINKDFIVKSLFGIGNYINYDYKNTSLKTIETFIGIPKVGDYYIGDKTNSYLLTTNDLQAIFSINENSNYYLTFPSEEKKVYPVLKLSSDLKIKTGDGTIKKPYELSR